MTPAWETKTTEKRGGPRKGRPNAEILAKGPADMVTDAGDVAVDVSVLQAAVDLIATQHERERQAYQRGVLFGYAEGWEQRGLTERERRSAA